MPDVFKHCASCKAPILAGATYWRCSVSTCNSGRFQLAFCSVRCWDAHVPTMNHRQNNVWAVEERAPRGQAEPPKPAIVTVKAPVGGAPARATPPAPTTPTARPAAEPERRMVRADAPAEPDEVLIIASRLKDYIRARSEFNTSADVLDVLSDIVREKTLDAIDRARAEGRKTVMARDYRR